MDEPAPPDDRDEHDERGHHAHEHDADEHVDRFEHFVDEAIEAEMETGRREETEEEAKRHLIVRLVRIVVGVILLIVGLVFFLIPGPGLLTVAIALGLLAQDVPFARRLRDNVRERLPEDEDGSVKPWVIVVSLVGTVAFTGASLWFAFAR